MTVRRSLIHVLTDQARSLSSLARELGLRRQDLHDELAHAIRSAQALGYRVHVDPARCRQCDFVFDDRKLSKPGKCPRCRGTRLLEPQIRLER